MRLRLPVHLVDRSGVLLHGDRELGERLSGLRWSWLLLGCGEDFTEHLSLRGDSADEGFEDAEEHRLLLLEGRQAIAELG
jgi:hypothetical protein